MENTEPTGTSGKDKAPHLSRRTVVLGAAWSVPVIAAATAVPLASASEACTLVGLQPVYVLNPSTTTLTFALTLVGAKAGHSVSLSIVAAPNGEGGSSPNATLPVIAPGSKVTTNAGGAFTFQVIGQGAAGVGDFVLTIDAGTCGIYTTVINVANPATSNVRFWGYGRPGSIGDGTNRSRFVPTSPAFSSPMSFVDVGGTYLTSFAVRNDGKVFAWGENDDYQFGKDSESSNTPVEVPLPAGVSIKRMIDSSRRVVFAVGTDNKLYSWGKNTDGGTGQGGKGINDDVAPGAVSGLTNVTDADGGRAGGIAIDGGVVKIWGRNTNGQIGNGVDGGDFTVPVEVTYFATNSVSVTSVAASEYTMFAVSSDGDLYTWGYYSYGLLGNGRSVSLSTPTAVAKVGDKKYTRVWANYNTAFALQEDGTLLGWGNGDSGQFGDGTRSSRDKPAVAFAGVTGIVDVAVSYNGAYVLTSSGDIYFAGWNPSGEAGNGGTPAYFRTPTKVFRETTGVTAIGAGYWCGAEVLRA